MKQLIILRGTSPNPYICTGGDKYDSTARLYNGFTNIYWSDFWNTDHTKGYKGGILAKGIYYGIVGPRAKDGKTVIKLFRATAEQLAKIKTGDDLTIEMMTLPSECPNPNHKSKAHPEGEYFMQYVQCHAGGATWDYSHGCLTALNKDGHQEFDELLKHLDMNETIIVMLG